VTESSTSLAYFFSSWGIQNIFAPSCLTPDSVNWPSSCVNHTADVSVPRRICELVARVCSVSVFNFEFCNIVFKRMAPKLIHTFLFSTCRQVPIIAGRSSGTRESIPQFTQPRPVAGREFTGRLPGSNRSHTRSSAGS